MNAEQFEALALAALGPAPDPIVDANKMVPPATDAPEPVGEIVRLPCAEHDGYYTTVEFKRDFVSSHPVGTKLYATPPAGAPAYGLIDPDYARVFTIARCLAWSEGYMLAMHGSFTRDLDLIAVPWTDHACEPEHLMRRIEDAAGLNNVTDEPGQKPHGRIVWTLMFPGFSDPRFVDLGIIPPRRPSRGRGLAMNDKVREALDRFAYYADYWRENGSHDPAADIATLRAYIEGLEAEDTKRLDWLDANEAGVAFHREDDGDGEYSIWCNVVKDGESISGHPLAYVRDAIDAAMAAAAHTPEAPL